MKPRNFFLIFIFGLFLFLLPNFAEAECEISCMYKSATADCRWGYFGAGWERLGIIGSIEKVPATDGFGWCYSCTDASGKCNYNKFSSGSNGQSCTARDACWFFGCSEFTKSGVWDAYESQCVTCSGYKEDRILGNTSAVYAGCGSENGNAGDGLCESACGAAAACDEKAVGASCGTGGTCNSSCQCIVPECNSCSVSNMSCPSSVNTGQSFNITFDYYGTGPTGYPYEHRSLWRGTTRIGCKYGNATECSWHSDSFSTTAPTTPGTYTYYVKCYGASSQSTTYCDSADSSQSCDVKVCECTSTTIGGCCDGCNYCPAGKVFNGTSCVDATATVKCASTVNKCTAGQCSGEKRYPECQAGGVCDSSATSYYTSATVYASANKVFTTTCTDQDATSASLACDANTNYQCTEGSCSGYYRYSECNGAGTCDGAATTYYQQYNVVASTGYTLTSTCGTTGTTNCDTNFCWDGAGHHEKCDRRCNAAYSCDYYNCVDHCTNAIQDCDETGFNCGGSCPSCDTTPPTTTIKVKRKSTGEDLTAAGSWLRADTYTIQFEDKDQADGSGSNCENCSCEYSIYSCDVGGTNCNTVVISLTSRTPNSSFDIVAGKTAPTYNLEGAGRYRIYSGARDMAGNSAFEYRYINLDFTPPKTEFK